MSNFIGNNCEPKWNVELLNQPLLPLSCTSCGAAVFGVSCSAWEGGWGAYVCTGQIGNKMSKTPNRSFLNKICCRVSGFMPWCDFSVPRSGFSVPTWFSPAVLIGLKTIFSSADCTGTARSVPPLSPPEDRVQKPNSMNCMRPQTGIKWLAVLSATERHCVRKMSRRGRDCLREIRHRQKREKKRGKTDFIT